MTTDQHSESDLSPSPWRESWW